MRVTIPRAAVALALLAVVATACDAPLDPATEPTGIVLLRADGSEAARYVHPGQASGRLLVPLGRSATFRVRVIDQNGNQLRVDGIDFQIRQPVVVIALAADVEVEDDDELVLTGLQTRNTTLRVQLWHDGHFEFEARDIPLSVQSS